MTVSSRSDWLSFGGLIIVNLLWAAQYPAYKIASDHVGVASLNFWTLLVAIMLLLPFRRRELRHGKSGTRSRTGKAILEFTLLGIFGIIPSSVMLTWGILHSSASNAAILSLANPILLTALGVFMLSEKLTVIRIISLLLGLIGTLLISASDLARASFNRQVLLGNLIIFLAGMGGIFYNTYSKDLLSRYTELQVLLYSYIAGAAGCAVISVIIEPRPFHYIARYPTAAWLSILVLGALSWGLAMIIWMWVLNRLDVGQVSVSIYLQSLFGLLLSVVMIHEHITLAQILGGGLAMVGTAILTLYENRRSHPVA